MCECQGNPLARVTLALGLPYLLVNRALDECLVITNTKERYGGGRVGKKA